MIEVYVKIFIWRMMSVTQSEEEVEALCCNKQKMRKQQGRKKERERRPQNFTPRGVPPLHDEIAVRF